MIKVGCYIHIPFCEKKCYYCDFAAFPNLENRIELYIKNLIKEIGIYRERMDLVIDSIYIGIEVFHDYGKFTKYVKNKYFKRKLAINRNYT